MNNTLNKLALLSFSRKANKLNGTIVNRLNEIDNPILAEQDLLDLIVKKGSTIHLWSFDNGFYAIDCKEQISLGYCLKDLLSIEKYKNDPISHFGIYNPNGKTMTVYRSLFEDTDTTKPKRDAGRYVSSNEAYHTTLHGLQTLYNYWHFENVEMYEENDK